MTMYQPQGIPSMEPVSIAIELAMRNNLAIAYTKVNDLSPEEDAEGNPLNVFLELPQEYREVLLTDMAVNNVWPTMSIITSAPRMEAAVQQQGSGGGRWRGSAELYLYDMDNDPVMLMHKMHRYGAAMWGVVSGVSKFGRAVVDEDTFELQFFEDPGATPTARAVGIRFDVTFRT